MKILIAENDPTQSEALKKLITVKLGEMSFEVDIIIVTTLKEALLHAAEASATILDATLSDASPEDMLEAVREKKFRSPTIFLTGNSDPDFITRCGLIADFVFLKGEQIGICRAILDCFAKNVIANTLPA